jgi:diguanylate cyclase (GGDEF)-like protein
VSLSRNNTSTSFSIIKNALFLFLPLCILVAALVFLKFSAQKEQELYMLENMQSQSLLKEEQAINHTLHGILTDLFFIADLDSSAAFLYGDPQIYRFPEMIADFAQAQRIYDRIMVLPFDNRPGLIVNYSKENSKVELRASRIDTEVFPEELRSLRKGEILIVPPGTEDEKRNESESQQDILAFYTPVAPTPEETIGIVSLEYSDSTLFARIGGYPSFPGRNSVLLDSRGNWLGEFPGFMHKGQTMNREEFLELKNKDPMALEMLTKSPEGQFYGEEGLYTFVYVYPFLERIGQESSLKGKQIFRGRGSPPWKLLTFVPNSYIALRLKPIIVSNIVLFVFVSLGIFLASLLFAKSYEKRRKQALVDPLTYLWNRRFFMEKMEKIQGELRGDGTKACLALIDLGNFKDINDNLGHSTGDQVLVKTASIITENIRINDDAARYGGDEFILFLPRTGIKEAYPILERICSKIRKVELPLNEYILEADYGIAEYPLDSSSLTEIIEIADSRMYRKKKHRKSNCEIKKLKDEQ